MVQIEASAYGESCRYRLLPLPKVTAPFLNFTYKGLPGREIYTQNARSGDQILAANLKKSLIETLPR